VNAQDEGLPLEMGVRFHDHAGSFPPEYKAEVVELVGSTGKTMGRSPASST
jgi:hypothetical protein